MKGEMRYIASALEPASWPRVLTPRGEMLPEIALAGRSNVGKSTLINLLSARKKLAKISTTPGKTQRLQFFCFDERCLFVDLPGYGFAKAPASVRCEWSDAIDQYLNTRPSLKLVLLLLDIRRAPSSDDLSLFAWSQQKQIPLLPVFTKTDMISPRECEQRQQEILSALHPRPAEFFSVPNARNLIWSILLRYL